MTLFFQTLKVSFLEIVADILYFPIWWYTGGLWLQVKGVLRSLGSHKDSLAIGIWVKNIGKPMYGQYDLTGRLISFFARSAQIIGRLIWLAIWAVLLLIWLLIWILIPLFVIYLVYMQTVNFI